MRYKAVLVFLLMLMPIFVLGATRLLVVHPLGWQGSEKVHPQIDNMLGDFDTVTWIKSSPDEGPWPFSRQPDDVVIAPAGMIAEDTYFSEDLYVVGGYYKACFQNVVWSLQQHDEQTSVSIVLEGVYYGSNRTLVEQGETQELSDEELLELLDKVDRDRARIVRRKYLPR